MADAEITVNYIEDDSAVAPKKKPPVPSNKRTLSETAPETGPFSITELPLEKRPKKHSTPGGFGGNAGAWKSHVSSIFGKNPEKPKITHAVVTPVSEPVFSVDSFVDVGVHSYLVSNLKQNFHFEIMTEIQRRAIPAVLTGRDVLIKSQTGSGKTLTYVVPILHKLQEIKPNISREHGCYALVIVPTRELALQTYEWLRMLCRSFAWIVPGVLTGGEKRKSEKARIRKGINVLVTTPGRLLDHVLHTANITFNRVQWLVLDEADRLTDMGYEKDIAQIVQALNDQQAPDTSRQTILLSATLTPAVERLAGLTMKNRLFVDVVDSEEDSVKQGAFALPANLRHHYVVVPAKLRLVSLLSFLLDKTCLGTEGKVIVFMGTQDMVDYHCELVTRIFAGAGGRDSKVEVDPDELEDDEGLLEGLDFDDRPRQAVDAFIARLHGSMEQKDRTSIFTRFREAKTGILLCTDVAARGLDLPKVHWIVQYNAPTAVEDYIHRVGRTARVGNKGAALIFLEPSECGYIKHLEEQQIKLRELSGEEMLTRLLLIDDGICPGRSMEQRATGMQVTAESLVMSDKDLHDRARRAYSSFVSFYATYPRIFKSVFCPRSIHLGHYAKSFALRDTPSELARTGRKVAMRMAEKEAKAGSSRRIKGAHTSLPSSRSSRTGYTTKVVGAQRVLRKFSKPVSEFDSGLDVIASENKSGKACKHQSAKRVEFSGGKKKMKRF